MKPLVAIGASAGGLQQISLLLDSLPVDPGAAFVVLQHLDPTHTSQLADLLSRSTPLPVVTIEDRMPIQRNRVHVIPAGHGLDLEGDVFRLWRQTRHETIPTLIDHFFRQLAVERKQAAVGILLSGSGSDGALGLKAIKAEGGLTLVQDPDSAAHDGMPRAATRASSIDYVGDTAALVAPLVRYLRLNTDEATGNGEPHDAPSQPAVIGDNALSDAQLDNVLRVLQKHGHGAGFVHYKSNMLKRRIQRRIGINGLHDLDEYTQRLKVCAQERQNLTQDFLISVTDFFREPGTYEMLREQAIDPVLKERDSGEKIRVWVPGCATGEEAYSIAIVLAEAIEATGKHHDFILFATDIDTNALDVARAGLYPESVAADMSEQRLRAFFDRTDAHYRIKRSLRERVVFASQNVIEDPPYSRLDLISCRQLLMYLKPKTQHRVLAMFHFALNSDGYLLLGQSETIGTQTDLFEAIAKDNRLFRRIGSAAKVSRTGAAWSYRASDETTFASRPRPAQPAAPQNVEQIARDILLKEKVPASVLINRRYEVLCSYGPTRRYLSLPFGGASFALMDMIHDELRNTARSIIHRAYRDDRKSEITVSRYDSSDQALRIEALPMHDPEAAQGLMLVTFEPVPQAVPAAEQDLSESQANQQLVDELDATRNDLQSTIQALEASNEDLMGSNEEIQSMNEELQSTNEELETSKEELQSLNEELTTVNSELEQKVAELETTRNDLSNLFRGTRIATLFLDRTMCIKRFTPATQALFSVISSDIGHPLSDITHRLDDPELQTDAENAMDQLQVYEKEIQAHDGAWYLRRVSPYRTHDDSIEGVVITFTDISDLKRAWLITRESEQRLDLAMSAINGGMWEMSIDPDHPGDVSDSIYLSARLKRLLGFEDEQLPNSLSAWQERVLPEDRTLFANMTTRPDDGPPEALHYRVRHRDGTIRWFASYKTLVPDPQGSGERARLIGIDCDVTELKQSDARTRRVADQLRLLANAMPKLIIFVDSERLIQFTNTAYNEWFDVREADVAGTPVDTVFGEQTHHTFQRCVEVALAGQTISCNLTLEHERHGRCVLQVDHLPYVVDNEVIGFYALMSNITHHKRRHTDQLAQHSNLVYVQRMATVGEMASTLAHDINQPLSAINTYASTLTHMLHAGKPASETTPLLRKIADQVTRASGIINQTRDFVGRRAQDCEAMDLNELVDNVIALLDGRAKRLNVEIRLEKLPALPSVNGYPVQIEQVLVNLISNAFDAMEAIDMDRRVLRIGTQCTETDHVQVGITDSGDGIDADKITTIFDAFHTTKLEGMGMGLAISRSITEWHGGQLWAESRSGHGASFILKLPVASKR